MFKERVMDTALTTEEANSFFSRRIYGDTWAHDHSFVSTLRALVGERMPDDDSLIVCTLDFPIQNDPNDDSQRKFILERVSTNWYSNTLYVINLYNPYDKNFGFGNLESEAPRVWKGYQRVEKVTAFFHKVMGVLCYINPDTKTSIVAVDGLNLQKYHYLQCGTFAFLPWYFNADAGCTEDEMAVLNALREKTPDKYLEAIEKIAEAYDFERSRIVRLLEGFENKYDKKQRDQIQYRLSEILENIAGLDRRYREYMQEKRDCEIRLLGLDKKILEGSEDNEIMDYFIHNRSLSLKNVDDNYMEFVVRGTLDTWSSDNAEAVINNERSFVYYDGYRDYQRSKVNRTDMKKLMTAIFVDEILKVRVCAAFRFVLGIRVEPLNAYTYPNDCITYLPNPHIDRYGCMGDYLRIINESVKDNDYMLSLEQTSQSARSLNFGDSTVMREFMDRMYGTDRRFIETPDGQILSPADAVRWIKATEACEETIEKGEVDG